MPYFPQQLAQPTGEREEALFSMPAGLSPNAMKTAAARARGIEGSESPQALE